MLACQPICFSASSMPEAAPAIMLVVLMVQVVHKDECAQLAGALLNAWTEVPFHCQDVQGHA